jgi:glycosyltransferase involved in cell wall biosynthesis
MKISIAMATYNGAEYIGEQLQSFVDQVRQPDEVVIVDDCSSDNTVQLIQAFAQRAPFDIRVSVNEENLGYAGNFNAALQGTKGDLVFLSDQDDVWFPDKIEYMLILSQEKPNYLIYMNDALLTGAELNSCNLTKFGQVKSTGLGDESFVMGCCCAIRRELLDFALPIPQGLKAHDNWLVEIAGGLLAKRIDAKVLQYYRRHGGNESQFVANRLTRVSRWNLYADYIINALRAKKADRTRILDQAGLFLGGLVSAQSKVPAAYQASFAQLIDKRFNTLELLKKRIHARESFFLIRILKIMKLVLSGYPAGKRISHAVHDLLG